MKHVQTGLMLLFAAMLLGGCGATRVAKTDATDTPYGAGAKASGAGGPETGQYGAAGGAGAYGADGQYGGTAADSAMNGRHAAGGRHGAPPDLSKRIIYFQYDSSEVLPEYVQVINKHANYLASNPRNTVVLEGHADERGSPEYNIALGEQRAKSVANLMKLQGVAEEQIQIVSFGEEKPDALGHDDSAWQQNRRVEISYPSH